MHLGIAQRSFLAFAGAWLTHLGFALAEPLPTLEQVIEKISTVETQLRYVRVEHFIGSELVRNGDGTYSATPKLVEGSVTYDGVIGGRFIAEKKEVLPFVSGDPKLSTGTWLTTVSSQSYDGSSGRSVYHHIPGNRDTLAWSREAKIHSRSPLDRARNLQAWSDGSAATLGYFRGYMKIGAGKEEYLVGEHFGKLMESKSKLDLSAETIDGVFLLKVDDPGGNQYWFEPGRGYALRRAVAATPPNGAVGLPSLVVEELTALNATTWYATRGYWEYRSPDGKESKRWSFRVTGVTMSDTPPPSFTATIPEGYQIDDMITGKVYQSAGTMKDLSQRLDNVASDAMKEVGRVPPSTSPVQTRPNGAPVKRASDEGFGLGHIVWISMVVLSLTAIGLWWRHYRRSAAILIIACSVFCARVTNASPSVIAPDFVQNNCGVNVAYLTLALYDRDRSLEQISSELNTGPDLSRECSLGSIKRVCENVGLSAQGVTAPSVSQFLKDSSTDFVAVVRLQEPGVSEIRHHFVLVARRVGKPHLFIDAFAANAVVRCEDSEIEHRLMRATGEMLLIWESVPETGPSPSLLHDNIQVGAFSAGAQPILVRLHVKNSGDQPFKIEEVKTSCGCVGTSIYDPHVLPGRVNVISLQLDPRSLPPGKGDRRVAIKTSVGDEAPLIATIAFEVESVEQGFATVSAAPSMITFGKVRKSDARGTAKRVYLTIPNDIKRYGSSVRVLVDCPDNNISVTQESLEERSEGTMLVYAVTLQDEPSNTVLENKITFRVWRHDTRSWDVARVALSGQFY